MSRLALVPETAGTPLGADAAEPFTPQLLEDLWAAGFALPVPDYDAMTLARLERADG